ncbi:MAG: 3-deoxy-manno-octulosonate cytidylyltransferase [Legionellales bacterium]|nr:3-deoxy-manno-octulosonate cytidylyltransferase [Legionellales bacterium]|tara:strand:+ start:1047 stop:1769 length:723 start_codon:yes stop_codon:yes gene_type:complete
MKLICIIPARYGSTRLSKKMLLPINGKSVIQRTYESAVQSDLFHQVIVATDHEQILNVIHDLGGEAVMTPSNLPSGSDRVAYVAKSFSKSDVIVNLQGDQPFIKASMLQDLVRPFKELNIDTMSTVGVPIEDFSKLDHSHVKVLVNMKGEAIYFSRANIPFQMQPTPHLNVLHHIGLYAYTQEFLMYYSRLPRTGLEQAESLEQLRVIEHGDPIYVTETQGETLEINTSADIEKAIDISI